MLNKFIKYSKIGVTKLASNFRVSLYSNFKILMPWPKKAYYLISNKCNYQCAMCPQWKNGHNENVKEYISLERMEQLIDEMSKTGIKEFGISGGEPLLFKEKALALLKYANKKGMHTHFVTNGSLVTEEILKEYDACGGGHLSLSLDAIGEKHDKLRGREFAYDNALKTIKLASGFKNILLKINITLSSENLKEIMPVLEKAKEVNAVTFIQPYDPYDYGGNPCERAEKFPLWMKNEQSGELVNIIEEIIELKRKNPGLILNSEKHLLAIKDYFFNPEFHIKCGAAFDQITIDPFGNVIFCKYRKIGNLNKISLKDFFHSRIRKQVAEDSLKCEEGCLLGCMYHQSASELLKTGFLTYLKIIKK